MNQTEVDEVAGAIHAGSVELGSVDVTGFIFGDCCGALGLQVGEQFYLVFDVPNNDATPLMTEVYFFFIPCIFSTDE